MGDITMLLQSVAGGDLSARDQLFALTYERLRTLARAKLAREAAWTQLDATSLVHEVFLRLTDGSSVSAVDRRAFFALAASVMRNVLVDHARRRQAAKRGGGVACITLMTEIPGPDNGGEVEVEALDAALQDLRSVDERCHSIVELRYFAGLSNEEIAEVLNLSLATVKRDWQKARAFLYSALRSDS